MGSVCMYGEMLHSCDLLQGYMNQDCRTSGIITVTGRDGSLPAALDKCFISNEHRYCACDNWSWLKFRASTEVNSHVF